MLRKGAVEEKAEHYVTGKGVQTCPYYCKACCLMIVICCKKIVLFIERILIEISIPMTKANEKILVSGGVIEIKFVLVLQPKQRSVKRIMMQYVVAVTILLLRTF